jgi:hypothetical protein
MTSKENIVVGCPVKIDDDTENAITIHLDESNVVATNSSSGESDDSSSSSSNAADHHEVPLAEIRLLLPAGEDAAETGTRSIAAEAATISSCAMDSTEIGSHTEQSYGRPELLSAICFRTSRGGVCSCWSKDIDLEDRDGWVIISHIDEQGIFSTSKLKVGDQVVCINSTTCLGLKANQAMKIIRKSRNCISMVVRNKSGDPRLVSATLVKRTNNHFVGIRIKNMDGTPRLIRIDMASPFWDSVLNVDDRCLFVNDVVVCDSAGVEQATETSKNCQTLTILAEPNGDHALVAFREPPPSTTWWKKSDQKVSTGMYRYCIAQKIEI